MYLAIQLCDVQQKTKKEQSEVHRTHSLSISLVIDLHLLTLLAPQLLDGTGEGRDGQTLIGTTHMKNQLYPEYIYIYINV